MEIVLEVNFYFFIFQRDPSDEDIPYCTLKSFPATIEHCIQWARDKVRNIKIPLNLPQNSEWNTYCCLSKAQVAREGPYSIIRGIIIVKLGGEF